MHTIILFVLVYETNHIQAQVYGWILWFDILYFQICSFLLSDGQFFWRKHVFLPPIYQHKYPLQFVLQDILVYKLETNNSALVACILVWCAGTNCSYTNYLYGVRVSTVPIPITTISILHEICNILSFLFHRWLRVGKPIVALPSVILDAFFQWIL